MIKLRIIFWRHKRVFKVSRINIRMLFEWLLRQTLWTGLCWLRMLALQTSNTISLSCFIHAFGFTNILKVDFHLVKVFSGKPKEDISLDENDVILLQWNVFSWSSRWKCLHQVEINGFPVLTFLPKSETRQPTPMWLEEKKEDISLDESDVIRNFRLMKCLIFFFSPKFSIYWWPVNTDFGMPLKCQHNNKDSDMPTLWYITQGKFWMSRCHAFQIETVE